MHRHSSFNLPRALCAMVMLFAWLAISNHCALGGIAKNKKSAQIHARCCGSNAPQGGTTPGPDLRECCKTLHALPTPAPANLAKLVATGLTDLPVWTWVDEALAVKPAQRVEWMDGGPPRAHSFAELVLQRSLRSHAPPFFA